MNENQIRNLFHQLNTIFFQNQLPAPDKINFRFVKKYYGQFEVANPFDWKSGYHINFSSAYNFTDFEYEKILIHEMIHVWQWVNNKALGHGHSFKSKAMELNSLTNNKYEINRCTHIENPISLKDVNKPQFEGYIITYKYNSNPNKIFVSKCLNNIAFKRFKMWVPKCSKLQDIHCYCVKGQIYNSFPNSVKCLRGVDFTKEEFEKVINPTIIFEDISF
jgi:hypothetical protein